MELLSSKYILWAVIILCPLMHLVMMKVMGRSCHQTQEACTKNNEGGSSK